jgi:hypothetical protein
MPESDEAADQAADSSNAQQESLTVRIPLEPGAKKRQRVRAKKGAAKASKRPGKQRKASKGGNLAFPKRPLEKCIRIPQAILDQNAGNECTNREAAGFAKLGWTGPLSVEVSSAIKYGLLERPSPGKIRPTDLVRRIVRPQQPNDQVDALRQAVLNAPVIGDVYKRYRGENLPDREFLINAVVDSFKVPQERVEEFLDVFIQSLQYAQLLEETAPGKSRVLDVTQVSEATSAIGDEQLKKLARGVSVQATDTCFVVMPFADPIGGYFASVYQPAIERAKLKAVRADADIFGTGKIIDQIWSGIQAARVLVAELTGRNPNVFVRIGLGACP